MDLLYSRYASPFEFMGLYIQQGRLGEFVSNILEMDFKRRREIAEKENDDRLWSAYIRSLSKKTFKEWKEDLKVSKQGNNWGSNGKSDKAVSKGEINAAIQKSQEILSSFVPD